MGGRIPADRIRVAACLHAGHYRMAPPDSVPRPRIRGAGGELSTLMRGLMGAQANDSGWPTFSGKYVEYP